MTIATKASNIAESKAQRTHYDRATLWRFHNSLYLGCVIGALTGVGYGHALLCWPKRAWQRASLREKAAGEPKLEVAGLAHVSPS